MDKIGRLRALEKKWRLEVDGSDERGPQEIGYDACLLDCADELATLIAELGQEVGAEQADSCCAEDDGCPTEMAVLKRFWRQHSSPAHTSEARDALMAWAVKNDVAAGECDPNRRVIPLAALNQYAAMRQEAGE